MVKSLTCIVTIHGIGFEQPPQNNVANSGYADPLHQHLKADLKELLSDDPQRLHHGIPGENGAIYVESRAYNHDRVTIENGLERLGRWNTDGISVDGTDAPLVARDEPVSHIALVYSRLEPDRGDREAARQALKMSLSSLRRYSSFWHLLRQGLLDGWAMYRHATDSDNGPISARPRHDQPGSERSFTFLNKLRSSLWVLEDDVACYVRYNDERERVRDFVAEALTRLAHRCDVENIVLNTHSNGTVVAFDVVRHLSPEVTRKIKAFVTAGSPLRKYVDFFSWGNEVQACYAFEPWYNFLDKCDPVADPLGLPAGWKVGQKSKRSDSKTSLFSHIDLFHENPNQIQITDLTVDNVKRSAGGGLRAHNYWDNIKQFIPQLSTIIRATLDHQRAGNKL